MLKKQCIAMILAGGQGSRLAALTTDIPKPAIPFGGSCRIIDFSLSNCYNSKIDTLGILTSQQYLKLNNPMDSMIAQGLSRQRCNINILPPTSMNGVAAYLGTANAIYENINFVDQFNPEYVVILSGDQVYKMDYNLLLAYHKEKAADVTISVITVPWLEAARFGIISVQPDGSVREFNEKPLQPKSNLASMGIYIFSWPKLKKYLALDESHFNSNHDFGKNIIPDMLDKGEKIYAYPFREYWRDVGTVESLYEAQMDLLAVPTVFDIQDMNWPIYSTLAEFPLPVSGVNCEGKLIIGEHCCIHGEVENSIIFPHTYIGSNAKVKNSVLMPGVHVGHSAYIENTIIGPGAVVKNGCSVVGGAKGAIAVVAQNAVVSTKMESGYYTDSQVANIDGKIR